MEYKINVIDLIEFLKFLKNMCYVFLNVEKLIIVLNVKIK